MQYVECSTWYAVHSMYHYCCYYDCYRCGYHYGSYYSYTKVLPLQVDGPAQLWEQRRRRGGGRGGGRVTTWA